MAENASRELTIRVESARLSDQGLKRPNNEDFVTLFEPNDPEELGYSGCLYIVADGVGGARKGERASQYAAEKVLYEYYRSQELPPPDRLATILKNVSNEIYDYAVDNAFGRMATTLVAAVVRGSHLVVANVGDSRAYLIRGGTVRQLTHDHNQLSELLRSGALTEEEAKGSTIGNVLTRSIGGHEDVTVDIFDEIQLYPGDRILLCSDGLHRYLQNGQLAELASSGTSAEVCRRLVEFAINAGGVDNITVLVVTIHAPEDATLPKTRRVKTAPVEPDSLETVRIEKHVPPRRKPARQRFQLNNNMLWVLGSALLVLVMGLGVLSSVIFKPGSSQPPGVATITSVNVFRTASTTKQTIVSAADKTRQALQASVSRTATLEATMTNNTVGIGTQNPVKKTITSTVKPDRTGTTQPGSCVHVIGEINRANTSGTISAILNLYRLEYLDGKEYTLYVPCDEGNICSDSKKKIVSTPLEIKGVKSEWYLLIPSEASLDMETCLAKSGLWVTLPNE